jgi:uncharacterized protein (TIGR02118 family)
MIRVAVLYPNFDGSWFNVEYYKQQHMKLVWQKLGPLGLVGCEVDAGIAGVGGARAPYAAIGYVIFETLDQFQSAFGKVGGELVADVPNYTNIPPVIQISEFEQIGPPSRP